jgi:protein transport protein SEC24
MIFVDGGRSFQCNFCLAATPCPPNFFCNLDHTGRRHDLADRHELTRGSVDYAANKVASSVLAGGL